MRKIHVIINPASGKNEPILNTLNTVFKPAGIQWDVSITQQAGDGARLAQHALAADYDLIMAYGGDGTLLDVAAGMLNADVPMAILPGGTANALADDLDLPQTLKAAAELASQPELHYRAIDVGKAGEHHFLLRVGTGMVARFSENVNREMKDRYGIAAYIIGGIQALRNPQFVDYTLEIDGETHETSGTACLVSNGNAIGALGIRLSKHIRIDDGLLDVFVINNDLQNILGVAGSIAKIDNLAVSLQHWQGRKIRIKSNPPQDIYGDGEEESFATTPNMIQVLPAALKVLVNNE